MIKSTTFQINLNLTSICLDLFKRVPTFKDCLAPNQTESLIVGDNILYVNRYIYAKLQRLAGYTTCQNKVTVTKL